MTSLCWQRSIYSKLWFFYSSHVWMWELDHKERWALKNWCFWTVVLEKSLGSPLDSKEIKPVNCKGNLSWIFIRRTDAEAETPILWPSDVKSWLIGKDPDAGKQWRHKEKGTTEDEMLDGITDSMDMHLNKLQEIVKDKEAGMLQSVGSQRSRQSLGTQQQPRWAIYKSPCVKGRKTV